MRAIDLDGSSYRSAQAHMPSIITLPALDYRAVVSSLSYDARCSLDRGTSFEDAKQRLSCWGRGGKPRAHNSLGFHQLPGLLSQLRDEGMRLAEETNDATKTNQASAQGYVWERKEGYEELEEEKCWFVLPMSGPVLSHWNTRVLEDGCALAPASAAIMAAAR